MASKGSGRITWQHKKATDAKGLGKKVQGELDVVSNQVDLPVKDSSTDCKAQITFGGGLKVNAKGPGACCSATNVAGSAGV